MAVMLELRWNGKAVYQKEAGLAQVRERNPVWVPLELAQVKAFGASLMTPRIHQSILDLEDHQVSWEA